jgi:hypothetical protein
VSRRAVGALTQTSASASLTALRIALVNTATLTFSCHSGWSKNVRSWMVTTLGTLASSGVV